MIWRTTTTKDEDIIEIQQRWGKKKREKRKH